MKGLGGAILELAQIGCGPRYDYQCTLEEA